MIPQTETKNAPDWNAPGASRPAMEQLTRLLGDPTGTAHDASAYVDEPGSSRSERMVLLAVLASAGAVTGVWGLFLAWIAGKLARLW
jgi:hypothetical protein